MNRALRTLCDQTSGHGATSSTGATAFASNWAAYERHQSELASIAQQRWLARFEWPSLYETHEVQETQHHKMLGAGHLIVNAWTFLIRYFFVGGMRKLSSWSAT